MQFWLGAPVAPAANPVSEDGAAKGAKRHNKSLARRSLSKVGGSRIRITFAGLAALIGALCYTVLTDGGRNVRASNPIMPKVEAAAAMLGLGVDQISITGQQFTADSDIFAALNLDGVRSIASLDVDAAKVRIEELPWVDKVDLQRMYPGGLEIRVTERKPWAVWRRGGNEFLIDQTGRTLASVKSGSRAGLPVIEGEGADTAAPALMALLARYPDIKGEFQSAERVAGRRWTLTLKGGNALVLPPEREAQALSLYTTDRTVKALTSTGGYVVDLRGLDKITVRKLQSGASPGESSVAPDAGAKS